MKRFAHISTIILFLAGVILLSFDIKWFPSFYDVRYMGVASLVGAGLIVIIPKLLRVNPSHPQAEKKNQAADLFQFSLSFALMNNALGDLGLYELYRLGFEYDKLVHFVTPLMLTIVLHQFFQKRFDFYHRHALLITFALVVGGALLWELYEYLADYFLETHLYGVFGTDIVRDTILDLTCGTLGALTGIIILKFSPRFKKTA